ncbi:hypothetical protein ACLB2K_075865 [Fragaria x ananassa]
MNVGPREIRIFNCVKLEVAQLACTPDHWKLITLKRLASLRKLTLRGAEDDGGLVSFPPAAENSKETEILLPRSLVDLTIGYFPNLKKLSKGFQFLTSLESLEISNCPKLTTLPVEEGKLHVRENQHSSFPGQGLEFFHYVQVLLWHSGQYLNSTLDELYSSFSPVAGFLPGGM